MAETDKRQLFAERLLTKGRNYFVDVKESSSGIVYLAINESRRNRDGQYEQNRVMVFEENIPAFREALDKAVQFIQTRPRKT